MVCLHPFLALILFFLSSCSLTQGQCFNYTADPSTFQLYETDTGPAGIVTADLNNDNRVDIATISPGQNTLSIRYATASGSVGTPVQIPVDNPFFLLAIDLNNDSRTDLALLNQNGDVLVLLNSETGFSQLMGPYEGISGASNVVQGDFNQDGYMDLAINSIGSNAFRILLNSGVGSFLSEPVQNVTNSGEWITADDFDSDGHSDLAMISYWPRSTITIYRNEGKATFTPVHSFTLTDKPRVINSADLNGDNKPDLVLTTTQENRLYIFLNTGHNQFELVQTEPNVSVFRPIIIQDVTGDTKPDLILNHWQESRVSVWANQGNGRFQSGQFYGTGGNSYAMSIGDITGDGLPDIVTANSDNSTLAVLTNKGHGQFGSASMLYAYSDFQLGAVGDIDNDGLPDTIGLSEDSTQYAYRQLKIHLNKGSGQFRLASYQPTQAASSAIALGDLNKDGWLDVVTTNRNSNSMSVMLNATTGNGSFLPPVQYPTGGASEPVQSVLHDINNDGFLDVVTYSYNYYESVQFFLNQGNGTLTPSTKFHMSVSDLSFTDLTNDGKSDMVVLSVGYPSSVNVYTNLGDGQFSTPHSYTISEYVTSAVSLDMNFDGYLDLIVSTADQIVLMLNKGDGTFLPFQTLLSVKNTLKLGLQDINGDGFQDLVSVTYYYQETNENTLHVYPNTGDGSFSQSINLPTGPYRDVTLQDMDGDQRADVVALFDNRLWIWYNCTVPLNYGFKTIQSGSWLDPAVWSHNRVPVATDRILLRHAITIPERYTGKAARIGYEANGQLNYESGASLKLQN